MDYEIKRENFSFCEKTLQASTEHGIDTEISLPDYCSDIQRILKCTVIPCIHSCFVSGDRATAEGEAVIRVMYVGESGGLQCYEQSRPFSEYVSISDADGNCSPSVKAKTEYVNCRALNQRRISVSGNIGLMFTATKMKKLAIPVSAKGGGVQTRTQCISTDMEVNCCSKIFEMGETVSLGDKLPSVGSVINVNAYPTVDTVKAVENKLLIKGEMRVCLLYCPREGDSAAVEFVHTMPLSQVLQLEDIDQDCQCDANVTVAGVCINPIADSSGQNRLLEISVKAEAEIRATRSVDCIVVEDCYSTAFEMKTEHKNVDFLRHICTFKEPRQIRSVLNLSPVSVSELCCCLCHRLDGSFENKNGKGKIKGSAIVGIIYKSAEEEYGYCEKTVDFVFDCPEASGENLIAYPVLMPGEISCMSVGEDKAEIRINVGVFMPVNEVISRYVCMSLEPDEEKPKKGNGGNLTVYFCEKSEKIWDIARKYNTTVEKIKEENELSDDEIEKKTVLMIPAVI